MLFHMKLELVSNTLRMIVDSLIVLVVHLLKTKNSKFMSTGNTNIYRNDLDKISFQHDMAYPKYKDLTKRTESDKIRDKAFKFANNPKHAVYERGLASTVYKFFDKKSKASGIKYMSNQKLADELHKTIIKKIKKKKSLFFI